jgi:hypothetical protein
MKRKHVISPMLIILSLAFASFTLPADRPVKVASYKKDMKSNYRCGPGWIVQNYSGKVITKLTIQGPNGTTTIFNPTFPYHHPQGSTGYYTFVFNFSTSASGGGAVIATNTYTLERVGCELYEAPYLAAMTAYGACYSYTVTINNDETYTCE